jgi:hypothetical protein
VQNPLRRSEHYRQKAVKYHELAKCATPPYLGDFYRGVAVRYVFMAQELSQQAEKELGLAAQPRDSHTGEVSTEGGRKGDWTASLRLIVRLSTKAYRRMAGL